MFIRFDVIHERDRQTDGRTLHDSLCIASRSKNQFFIPPTQQPHPLGKIEGCFFSQLSQACPSNTRTTNKLMLLLNRIYTKVHNVH